MKTKTTKKSKTASRTPTKRTPAGKRPIIEAGPEWTGPDMDDMLAFLFNPGMQTVSQQTPSGNHEWRVGTSFSIEVLDRLEVWARDRIAARGEQAQGTTYSIFRAIEQARDAWGRGDIAEYAGVVYFIGFEMSRVAKEENGKKAIGTKPAALRKRLDAVERMLVKFHRLTRTDAKKEWPRDSYWTATIEAANAGDWKRDYLEKALPKKYLLALYHAARFILLARRRAGDAWSQDAYRETLASAAATAMSHCAKVDESAICADLPFELIEDLATSMR